MLKVTDLSLLRPPIFSSYSNVCDRLIRGNLLFIFVVVVVVVVVVLSAGIGRTGTFIVIDTLINMIKEQGKYSLHILISKTLF